VCLSRAIDGAHAIQLAVLRKARFWKAVSATPINERQSKVLNRILDTFEGNLTSSKWAKLAKCSQDTAHRDILELVKHGILQINAGGGRSTSYSLKDIDP
jgi:Fic family protein